MSDVERGGGADLLRFAAEARHRVRVIETAITASEAIKWFGDYGVTLANGGRDSATVKVSLNYASSTAFVDRAQTYLDAAAQEMLPKIVQRANEMAGRDLTLGTNAAQPGAPS